MHLPQSWLASSTWKATAALAAMHGGKFLLEGLHLFKNRNETAEFTLCNPWQLLHAVIAVTASSLSVFVGGMANDSILCLPNEIPRLIADESISGLVIKVSRSTLTGPHKFCDSISASHNSPQWDIRSRPLSVMHRRVYKAMLPSCQFCRTASLDITESRRSGAWHCYPQDHPSPPWNCF